LECYQKGVNSTGESFPLMDNQLQRGASLLQMGDILAGQEIINRVVDFTGQVGMGSVHIPAQWVLATLRWMTGDLEQAKRLALWVEAESSPRSFFTPLLSTRILLGKLSLESGHIEEAQTYTRLALEMSQKMATPWGELNALLLLVRILHQKGEDDPSLSIRITSILDKLECNAQSESVHLIFLDYRKAILSSLL
jgi:ATP/maltotriose-dependent transcriptional regulator MalT